MWAECRFLITHLYTQIIIVLSPILFSGQHVQEGLRFRLTTASCKYMRRHNWRQEEPSSRPSYFFHIPLQSGVPSIHILCMSRGILSLKTKTAIPITKHRTSGAKKPKTYPQKCRKPICNNTNNVAIIPIEKLDRTANTKYDIDIGLCFRERCNNAAGAPTIFFIGLMLTFLAVSMPRFIPGSPSILSWLLNAQ